MAQASQAFDNHRGRGHLRSVPNLGQDDPPYEKINNGEMPPMMFQVRLADGQRYSFCYSDIRQIYRRDAGKVQIDLHALARTTIALEGRNLDEIVNLLGLGLVRWIRELDPRAKETAEHSVEITRIEISVA